MDLPQKTGFPTFFFQHFFSTFFYPLYTQTYRFGACLLFCLPDTHDTQNYQKIWLFLRKYIFSEPHNLGNGPNMTPNTQIIFRFYVQYFKFVFVAVLNIFRANFQKTHTHNSYRWFFFYICTFKIVITTLPNFFKILKNS